MKITVLGAGGVGGYFGAKLAQGGADVTMVARGAHGEAIAQGGLRVRSPLGDFEVKPRVVSRLGEAPLADVLLIAVKTTDLEAAIAPLANGGPRADAVVTVQNGLDADDAVARVLGGVAQVIGGVALIGSGIAAPGVIEHRSRGILLLGAPPGGDPARAASVVEQLVAHGVNAKLSSDLRRTQWQKLLWNIGFNPVTALTRRLVGEVMDDPVLFALVKRIMAETEAVGRAEGIALPADVIDQVLATPPETRTIQTSMLQDILSGKPLERDALVTSIIRRGRARGIATPTIEVIDALLAGAGTVSKVPS